MTISLVRAITCHSAPFRRTPYSNRLVACALCPVAVSADSIADQTAAPQSSGSDCFPATGMRCLDVFAADHVAL